MKVFLSYASEDRALAEGILLALRADGHDVFFDRKDLPPGEDFRARIRLGIERSDLFVFLVSAHALDAGSYTLNELEIAERTWKIPSGRILPVLLGPTDLRTLPAYLKSVTLLESRGDATAAVAEAVHRIAKERRRRTLKRWATVVTLGVCMAAAGFYWANREAPKVRVGKDDAPSAIVPGGVFAMGDDEESPRRDVYVDTFYMDRFETTTARYAAFLAATGSVNTPDQWEEVDLTKHGDLPVIGVAWRDADAYCRWAGRRLPTEAEWEKAARGTEAIAYPWGEALPTSEHANFENSSPDTYDGGLAPVGAHPLGKSPLDIEDMAGNVAEWVADWYSESFAVDDVRNPRGPADGSGKVIRGGGRFDPAQRIGTTQRSFASPDNRAEDIGFRCASDA